MKARGVVVDWDLRPEDRELDYAGIPRVMEGELEAHPNVWGTTTYAIRDPAVNEGYPVVVEPDTVEVLVADRIRFGALIDAHEWVAAAELLKASDELPDYLWDMLYRVWSYTDEVSFEDMQGLLGLGS
jgi:hypothetical protein